MINTKHGKEFTGKGEYKIWEMQEKRAGTAGREGV